MDALQFTWTLVCEFFAPGVPESAGSKQSFVPLDKRLAGKWKMVGGDERIVDWPRGLPYKDDNGRVIVNTVDANKDAEPWKKIVSYYARFAWGANKGLLDGAIAVDFLFVMPRPKKHYGTGRNANVLKKDAPTIHTIKPDGLKLSRAVEDALTDLIWTDDARIGDEHFQKIYGDKPGVYAKIFVIGDPVVQKPLFT